MVATTKINIVDGAGQTRGTLDAENVQFSAYRCFPMTGEADELVVLHQLVKDVLALDGGLALYRSGPFLDFVLDHEPELLQRVVAIVDPDGDASAYRNIPVVKEIEALPSTVRTLFVCETKAEPCMRLERKVLPRMQVVFPHAARQYATIVPLQAWIKREPSIYPIKLPEIVIENDLDILLIDLPSRAGQQISVGLSYVHSALKRSTVKFQTFDFDPLLYHRFHIHRLFDLGHDAVLSNQVTLSTDPWWYTERAWFDSRLWPYLNEFFAEDLDEIFRKIVAANPKIVGMSIHMRNEGISRELARRIKRALPDTLILVGGHSCYSDVFGKGAFPEYDYMVIGEADVVVGPLVERLAAGERPANLPGVLSVYDDPAKPFVPGPQARNLDMLGGIATDLYEEFNTIYQTWQGGRSTALPLTRGCVWSRCSFCAERFAFRSRTPKNYVDEMENIVATGRGGAFQASDSDFGGQPEVLREVCEEIVRRGLQISFFGQIRLSKNYDVEFFQLMRRAGMIGLNFGADALTENTIRRQAKGYTLDTLLRNHEDCAKVGIQPQINLVIGTPGETEQDMNDTIKLLSDHRQIFPVINNVNLCMLVQNSVYWFQPEKHNIHFYGDKEELYKKYYFGIPARLWYSTDPYIDRPVRISRFGRLVSGLQAAGIHIGSDVWANWNDIMSGVGWMEYRELTVDPDVECQRTESDSGSHPARRPHAIAPVMQDRLFVVNGVDVLAFPADPQVQKLLKDIGISFWSQGSNGSTAPAESRIQPTRTELPVLC